PDVTDAVLALHGEILLVSLGRHLGREAIDLVVNVKEERHGGRSFLATSRSALSTLSEWQERVNRRAVTSREANGLTCRGRSVTIAALCPTVRAPRTAVR